jgi:hypothetical protein
MPTGLTLKTHLNIQNMQDQREEMDRFLRLHFEHTLGMSALGGDITEDYDEDAYDKFMFNMGADEDGNLSDLRLTGPEWETPLGIEIHRFALQEKIAEEKAALE